MMTTDEGMGSKRNRGDSDEGNPKEENDVPGGEESPRPSCGCILHP